MGWVVRPGAVARFCGDNGGRALTGRPAFSFQFRPAASPGPQDSLYLLERFVAMFGPC